MKRHSKRSANISIRKEIIELTAVAAAFEMFSRFNSSLHIPVTEIPANV